MALGVIRAYQAAGKPLPKALTGETMVAFLREWKRLKDEFGFETIGITNPPGAAGALGLGFAVRLLQGKQFKPGVLQDGKYYYIPVMTVTNENFDAVYETVKDKEDSYFLDQIPTDEEMDALFQ
jgi:ABC-type sugar transport system substrate-binding protein